MPDLLAHALLAYAFFTALSWRVGWLTGPYITAGMAGAFVPDVMKVRLLLSSPTIEAFTGVAFSWDGIHTLGGATVCVLVGGVLVARRERRRVLWLLALGAVSHLLADALLTTPTGRSYALLWPVTAYRPPTPGLYLSTRPGPTVVAAGLAVVVYVLDRRRSDRSRGQSEATR